MRHTSGKVLSVVLFVIAILWCAVLLLFGSPMFKTFYYWVGYGCGALSLLIAAVVALLISGHGKDTTEIDILPDIATIIYAVFGIAFNYAFGIVLQGLVAPILIIGNVLGLLIYGVVLFALHSYAARVADTSARISGGISQYAKIRDCMPVLLTLAQDADVKSELLALKRTIESGNNMAQAITHDEEVQLFEQLQDLQQAMQGSADKAAILSQIAAARQTATLRNSKLY